MDHVNDLGRTVNKNHLEKRAVQGLAPNQILLIADRSRERRSNVTNHIFSFSTVNAVNADMFQVVRIPAKIGVH
jgi:hypothetical protein